MNDPVNLPAGISFKGSSLKLIVPKKISRMEGRRSEVEFGSSTWWTAQITTHALSIDKIGVMDSWLMQADAGAHFLAYEIIRPRPYMENTGEPLSGVKAVGGGPFDGAANLAAITNSKQITVDGMPDGFRLVDGDYLSIKMSELVRSMHKITEDSTANVSGVVALKISPGLNLQHFSVGGVVDFEKPACVMQMIGGYDFPKEQTPFVASFAAEEVFFQ